MVNVRSRSPDTIQSMRKNWMRHYRVRDDRLRCIGNCCLQCLRCVDWESNRGCRYRWSEGWGQSNLWCTQNLLRGLWGICSNGYLGSIHVLGGCDDVRLWCWHRDNLWRHRRDWLNRSHRRTYHLRSLALLRLRVRYGDGIDDTRNLNCWQTQLSVLCHKILVRCTQFCNLQFVGLHAPLQTLMLFIEPPEYRHDIVVLSASFEVLLHTFAILADAL